MSLAPGAWAADDYQLGPDSQRQDGVPKGTVTKHTWETSKVYPGTVRDYYVYVPAQYDGKSPACLMVFQDGHAYADEKGQFRAPIVFDNLIHRGQMPVTIGVFINPGNDPAKNPPPKPGEKRDGGPWKANNRSAEYDTLGDAYAHFLLDEVLPEVGKDHKITTDPEGRGICGMSSGGICAFTVAWERPDSFRKVASQIGSFTSIAYRPAQDGKPMRPGGDLYPTLIRKSPPKPLRVFLQDGSNDLDNEHGNWFLANQQMEAALRYANRKADEAAGKGEGKGGGKGEAGEKSAARYDVQFVKGDGGHSGKHGGAIFPDTMRWLWRDYKAKPGS